MALCLFLFDDAALSKLRIPLRVAHGADRIESLWRRSRLSILLVSGIELMGDAVQRLAGAESDRAHGRAVRHREHVWAVRGDDDRPP